MRTADAERRRRGATTRSDAKPPPPPPATVSRRPWQALAAALALAAAAAAAAAHRHDGLFAAPAVVHRGHRRGGRAARRLRGGQSAGSQRTARSRPCCIITVCVADVRRASRFLTAGIHRALLAEGREPKENAMTQGRARAHSVNQRTHRNTRPLHALGLCAPRLPPTWSLSRGAYGPPAVRPVTPKRGDARTAAR